MYRYTYTACVRIMYVIILFPQLWVSIPIIIGVVFVSRLCYSVA